MTIEGGGGGIIDNGGKIISEKYILIKLNN
jgi:hypothetical protein